MAKTSQVARQKKRTELVAKFKAKRLELKNIVSSPKSSPEDKFTAMRQLDELPRNASRVRLKSRCSISGRARAYMRDFGLSRIKFREMASQGYLPGVRMASW